jgi:dTDP-4-dehydrorhamnose reductase
MVGQIRKAGGPVVVTGAGGQLGRELHYRLEQDEVPVVALARGHVDITDSSAVERAISEACPSLVIHTAAATDVNGCEEHRRAAYRVNVIGAWNVARSAARAGSAMVYVSTNYVFDGQKLGPYFEYDDTAPLNAYGATKLQGEEVARQVNDRLYVVRTSWLYSRWGNNFVSRFLDVNPSDGPLRYVGDQVANPTHAGDLARGILELAETDAFGVHHLVNDGATSWYGWASAVLANLGRDDMALEEISGDEFSRAAEVPANSELANEMARSVGVTMRPWGEALAAHIRAVVE